MRTTSQPASGEHAEVISGIYIARGNDTLGPYNSLEAAALVIGGYLRLDDHAACNGDTAWRALVEFLPLSVASHRAASAPPSAPPPSAVAPHSHRGRWLAAGLAASLAILLFVAGGMHWLAQPPSTVHIAAPAPGVVPPPVPTPADVPPVAFGPVPASPPPTDGPTNGSLSFTLPLAEHLSPAGIQVSAYPLAALEPVLGQRIADAQSARARLDPQIEAAARERAVRASEADAALKALHEADPADPLLASLRFASQGAKAAVKNADDDYRYLLDERDAAAGGAVYFQGLPAAEITTETDVQGNFTLALPPGTEPYAVAASVRRTAEDGVVRSRYWLLQLSPAQRAGRAPVRLDDDTASSSPDAASLIHTAD